MNRRPHITFDTSWRFPEPVIFSLPNGIEVWCYHLDNQHVLHGALLLADPIAASEPANRAGVATITADALLDQTTDYSHLKLANFLADQAATTEAFLTRTHTQINFSVGANRWAAFVPLLASMVQRPDYYAGDIERHRTLECSDLEQMYARPAGLAAIGLRRALYDDSTRDALPLSGNLASLQAISTDDVREYHARWWTPDRATLIIAGALPDTLADDLDTHFGGWTPNGLSATYTPSYTDKRRVWIIDRPDAVQADIRLGMPSVGRDDPSWPALTVASCAMGGSFDSRLNSVLREERGYTYGAHCGFRSEPEGGTFTVQTSCRNEVAAAAVTEALDILDVTHRPFDSDEISNARNYLLGSAPLHFDTADAIVSQAAALVAGGLAPTWVNTDRDRVRTVTAAEASDAFARTVTPDAISIVIAGVANELIEPLKEAGLEPAIVELQP